MQTTRPGSFGSRSKGLAINGNGNQSTGFPSRSHPTPEGLSERLGVEFGKDAFQGIGTGNAILQGKESFKEALFGTSLLGHRFPGLGPGEDGTGSNREEIRQTRELVFSFASGIPQGIKNRRHRDRQHRVPPRIKRFSTQLLLE
jgi:hypothetical protein